MCSITLQIKNTKLTIIQVYAPTNKATTEEIDTFYDNLEKVYQTTKTEVMYIIGDFNARMGKQDEGEEHMIGKFGYGQRNRRGVKLINWMQELNLTFANSYFKKKDKFKWTWLSLDGKTKNEIDLILTNKIKPIMDVSTLPSTKFDSDHRMVRAKVRINHCTLNRNQQKYFTPKEITTEQKRAYNEQLDNKIREHIDTNLTTENIQHTYDILENIIKSSAKSIIKKKKPQKDEKISQNTKILINKREKLRAKENLTETEKQELKELRKTIKINAKNDIHTYNETKIKDIIKETKSIKKAKQFLCDEKDWIISMKNKSKQKTKRMDINETATEFFEKLFTSIDQSTDNINNNLIDDSIVFNEGDIKSIIDSLGNEKSAGSDDIKAEVLKFGKESLSPILTRLFNAIIQTQQIPRQWKHSVIILLHKKGDKEDINNYRPISLISTIYKLFSKALYKEVKDSLNDRQPREQAGFREGFSTTDHLQTMNQIIEKYIEYNKPLYLLFIDFSKAFDTVEHKSIWTALRNQSINPTFIQTLENLYYNNTAKVKTDKIGREFIIKRGVRQGDPISPPLFSSVLEDIFFKLNWTNRFGINIWGERLSNLRFADDIVLLSETAEEIETMLNELSTECKIHGLRLNLSKTKVMTNHIRKDISLEKEKIDYVDDYVYLGQLKSFKKQEEKEIDRRITNSWKQFWNVKQILDSKVGKDTQRYILDSTILPVMTYGLQSMALTSNSLDKLKKCQVKMERRLLNIRTVQRIRNEEIRRRTNITDVIQRIKQLKWSWAGHISRTQDSRWTKVVTKWTPPNESRPRGRPNKRWMDDLKQFNNNWYNDAKNRDLWAEMGEAYARYT